MPPRRSALLLFVLAGIAGCVYHRDRVEAVNPPAALGQVVDVASAVRAHLGDGTIVVFHDGARITHDSIVGPGRAYSLGLTDTTTIDHVLMDDVVGVEAYRKEIDAGRSFLTTTLAWVGGVAAVIAVACAADPKCFGSCPTVYTAAAGDTTLEAELFSYSIAPLLEGRDVDLLSALPGPEGVLRMEVRNEALETHFINHLEILEVRHAADERVVPDEHDRPLVVRGARPPARARGADGRDVLSAVAARDGAAYETSAARLADAADGGELVDHVELAWPRVAGSDTVAVLLRLRNSLLTSVIFYDLMLGEAGASALEWMGDDLQQIGAAVQLGSWWSRRMGLRVHVLDGGAWREVGRVADSGPIAWSHVAVPLAVPPAEGDSIRVRLSFAADQWRIDEVALADAAREGAVRSVPIARMEATDGTAEPLGLEALARPDEEYVETTAGTGFFLEFDVGPAPADGARTMLLSSQGFYNEWVRPAWIRGATEGRAFEASDETLRRAMALWLTARPQFEARFRATRIPVR